jgi:hypothetical protein
MDQGDPLFDARGHPAYGGLIAFSPSLCILSAHGTLEEVRFITRHRSILNLGKWPTI